jgi:hypothetical protein
MADQKSKFLTKISPLIEGQVPDFVQADHPVFVDFVKDYFSFLEAGRLTVTQTINYMALETNTSAYIINEEDEERIVTEKGEGTQSKFVNGEIVTGSTTGATATILVEDSRNAYIYITGQQLFQTGETITGGTSGSTATIVEYRGNPIQNIQQMLEYANVDNTLYDFLDQMRDSFMEAIPNNLADGVNKRNLIKNIKDLYAAKGTSEGHKLFMRMLLGEEGTIFYPNIYMMKPSAGEWGQKTTIRVTPIGAVSGEEIVNQIITGGTSGATATVISSLTTQQSNAAATFNDSVTILEIVPINGTFLDAEIITAISTTRDVNVTFTVQPFVTSTALVNDGILHIDQEVVTVETIGNENASIVIDGIVGGSVSEVIVDDAGTLYEEGDTLTFTSNSADTNVSVATGFVSMVGGGIQLETGTLDDSTITTDRLSIEVGTVSRFEPFEFLLEDIQSDKFVGDGTTLEFTLVNTSATTDDLTVTLDNVITPPVATDGTEVFTLVGSKITFTLLNTPAIGVQIFVYSNNDKIILNATDANLTNVNHSLLTENEEEVFDTYQTSTDSFVLENASFATEAEAGQIIKAFVVGGDGYTKLPTVTVSETTSGTGTKLIATTTNIGAAQSFKIVDGGLRYTTTNPPEIFPTKHFVLKDVAGTFAAGNTLTSHTGTIKSWDSSTQVLSTSFENVIRIEQEQTSATIPFQEGIQLEQGTSLLTHEGIVLEDEQDFDDGENIVLDGTGTFTPAPQTFTFKVKAVLNDDELTYSFTFNNDTQPPIVLFEGNTYYFDMSDPSLYNATVTSNFQLEFSETFNGTHNSGIAYTTGVTNSVANIISIGTAGSFVQIVVASGAPELFYYATNYANMTNALTTHAHIPFILGVGDNLVLDGTDRFDAFVLQESGTDFSKLTDRIQLEDESFLVSEDFDLELSRQVASFNAGSKLKLDRYHEIYDGGNQFLLFDGTDSSSLDAGSKVMGEDFGNTLVLDGTDADESDALFGFLLDDEIGSGQITLDSTAAGLVDTDDHIINEDGIDLIKGNLTITDSGGATATIISADIATGTTIVATTGTETGAYRNVNNRLGEDLVKIQDSYYYQDYSYEVQIGQSFATYINELKKAVHPAGFQPFGRVTLATLVSAKLQTTALGVSGYTGTTTFSPILASTLETIFKQIIQSRLEVPSTDSQDGLVRAGDRDNKIVLEDGDSILYEDKTITHTSDFTYGTGDGGGRMMNENSFAPSGTGDRVLVKEIFSRVVARPTARRNRNLLIYLAETPFGSPPDYIDDLVLDGTLPLDQADTFFQLERNFERDNMLLDGTSSTSADSGDAILLEDGFELMIEDASGGQAAETFNILAEDTIGSNTDRMLQEGGEWFFPIGFVSHENGGILLENTTNEETIPLSDIGHFQFNNILRTDKLIIQDGRSGPFDIEPNEEVGILMESSGTILLDGTSITLGGDVPIVENENHHLLQETSLRNWFELEENGALVVEDFQTNSIIELLIDETNNETIVFEDATADSFYGVRGQDNVGVQNFSIKLEYGEGNIILNSHGGDTSYDLGEEDQLLLEEDFVVNIAIALESTTKILSEGQIPFNNLTLNSSEINYGLRNIVRSADIKTRDTGDLALEDATDTTYGYLILNSTSGSATNAGENIEFEGGTGRTV